MSTQESVGESKQNGSIDEEGNAGENALYLDFIASLHSFESLLEQFEKMAPDINRMLQDAHLTLWSWEQHSKQNLQMRLQEMIKSLEALSKALGPDKPSDSGSE
jgi:hypothetical protein